jgi:hypothetical protein
METCATGILRIGKDFNEHILTASVGYADLNAVGGYAQGGLHLGHHTAASVLGLAAAYA